MLKSDVNKISNNQKGFSLFEVVLVVVVVALLGTAGWLVYKNHHKTPSTSVTACGLVSTDWTPCSNMKGNFIASFPNPGGPLPQTTFSHNGVNYTINGVQSVKRNGSYGLIYNVSYLTFTDSSAIPSLTSLLNNHLVPYQDITTVSSNSTVINGRKTETYEITATQNNVRYDLTGKMIQVGRVVYRIEAINANAQAPNAQRFINSFSLG